MKRSSLYLVPCTGNREALCKIQTQISIQRVSDHKSNVDEWMGIFVASGKAHSNLSASEPRNERNVHDRVRPFLQFLFFLLHSCAREKILLFIISIGVFRPPFNSIFVHCGKSPQHMGDFNGGSFPKSPLAALVHRAFPLETHNHGSP